MKGGDATKIREIAEKVAFYGEIRPEKSRGCYKNRQNRGKSSILQWNQAGEESGMLQKSGKSRKK